MVDRLDSRSPSGNHDDKYRPWRSVILIAESLAIHRAGPTDAEAQTAADRLLA